MDKVLATIVVNGQHCPVTNLFDCDGDDTASFGDAISAVALLPDGRWVCVTVSDNLWPLQ